MRHSLAVVVVAIALLAGCGSPPASTLTPSPTPVPNPSPSLVPGFTYYGGAGSGFTLGLPLGWQSVTPTGTNLFEAKSPTEGSLFVLLDDRPIAQDFNAWLADYLKEVEKISGVKPTIEHVMLAGGAAIKDTTNQFGVTPANYFLPVPGKGVLSLKFASLDPQEPAVWTDIAQTFGAP